MTSKRELMISKNSIVVGYYRLDRNQLSFEMGSGNELDALFTLRAPAVRVELHP